MEYTSNRTFGFVTLTLLVLCESATAYDISFAGLRGKRVLVVGGSGRVGGSVTTQLIKRGSSVTVGGTNVDTFKTSQQRWYNLFPDNKKAIECIDFATLHRENESSVAKVLQSKEFDLVVHTAGPFQGKVKSKNGVLEACLEASIPYIDVCDDYCTASAAKTKFAAKAINNNVPCIISTGCWPGVSSLMAKQLVATILKNNPNVKPSDLSVNFSFFTAGSGGAGVTLLVATFLILAEKALKIVNGRRLEVDAMADYTSINFGPIVGDRDVAPLNLLETASVHDVLGVGSTQSLFGTAPNFWNALLGLMAKLPSELLANEDIMRKLSVFSIPIVRLVDYFAGATNAMRCDVLCASVPDLKGTAMYAHGNLEPCVGECVAAFAAAILTKNAVQPGVWFPEEAIDAGKDAAAVLNLASIGAHTTTVNFDGKIEMAENDFWGSRKEKAIVM